MVGDALLGGVAHEVITIVRRPVLVVRLEMKPGEGDPRIQAARCDFAGHVLFPTDFSENADHAFAYVEKLAAEGARRVTRLHVQGRARIDPHLMDRLEEFDQIDRARPEEMRKRLPKAGGAEGKAAAPEFAGRRGRLAD